MTAEQMRESGMEVISEVELDHLADGSIDLSSNFFH